jgi:osmotically-inducible protein OsmY
MANDRYDYYRDHSEGRYNRDRDAYLDDRTGVGPSRGSGYRASYDEGPRRESRSFRPGRDYGLGGGYRTYPEGPLEERGDYSRDDRYRGVDYAYGFYPGFGNDLGGGYDPYPTYSVGYEPPYQYQAEPPHRGEQPRHRGFWDRAGDTFASWMGDEDARRRHLADVRTHSHQGRGPKAYKRSDARIHEDVNDRLTDDPWIDATHIDVKVADTEVTLSGTVANRDDRRHAERIAEHVSGVTHVQNNLRVDGNLATGRDAVLNPTLDRQTKDGGRH